MAPFTDVCEPATITPKPHSFSIPGGGGYNITNSQKSNLPIGGEPRGNSYAPNFATGYFVGYCKVTAHSPAIPYWILNGRHFLWTTECILHIPCNLAERSEEYGIGNERNYCCFLQAYILSSICRCHHFPAEQVNHTIYSWRRERLWIL